MATVQKRVGRTGEITWRVMVRRRGHPAVYRSFDRKTDADAFAAKVETDINEGEAGELREARRRTLAEAVDRYVAEVVAHRDDQSTRKHYQFWRDRLGHVRLGSLTAAQIAAARDDLAQTETRRGAPMAPATVRLYLASLSALFTRARREWRWTRRNPVEDVTKPKVANERTRYLSDDERTRLLAACRAHSDPRLHPFVMLALSTGARAGELYGLRWRDVDLERGDGKTERGLAVLHKTKNREKRALPLRGAALAAVREMLQFKGSDDDLVFPGFGSERFPYEKLFAAVVTAAGIRDFRFHDLRHSAASYLAMNGATTAEIAAVLGHRTLAMVKRYSHLSDGHVGNVVERMNEKFIGG
jgi:integrase